MTAPVETQLRCPASKCALRPMTLTDAEALLGATLRPANRTGSNSSPVGRTEHVMLRDDLGGAYPVLSDGIAVLMAPEILVPEGSTLEFDLAYPIYSEAYAEMGHYDGRATEAMSQMAVSRPPAEFEDIVGMPAEARRASFSSGDLTWIDSPYDCLSQMDCYGAIGDVGGHTVAQLGGSGSHAVKFLLAGAARAYLFAPMVEELRFARALAEACGVSDRLVTLAALAEGLPVAEEMFDSVYSGGCLHHMETRVAAPEIARALRPGGVFASSEPWRALLYGAGVRVFGQRERGAFCSPLTEKRLAPLVRAFDDVQVTHHGAVSRYPALVLAKARIPLNTNQLLPVFRLDDRLSARVPGLRGQGSSVSIIARKARKPIHQTT